MSMIFSFGVILLVIRKDTKKSETCGLAFSAGGIIGKSKIAKFQKRNCEASNRRTEKRNRSFHTRKHTQSKVHPFLDGNGRVSRVLMNAELTHAGESKIIIPTVFRDDYMLVLRKLTRQGDPEPYIRAMQRIHRFSAMVYEEDRAAMLNFLTASNAFLEPSEGQLRF